MPAAPERLPGMPTPSRGHGTELPHFWTTPDSNPSYDRVMSRVPQSNMNGLFVDRIAKALRERCGVQDNARLVAAVSGGADSVAMLRALAAIARRRSMKLALCAGHVHHHLRGDEADKEATFVERLAGQLELPFMRVDIEVDDGSGGNIEAKGRKLRYEALATMAEVFNAPFVATAHHGDDQLETLLMRMLRGTSLKGLTGIAWRRALTLPAQRPEVSGASGVSGHELALEADAREIEATSVHVVRPMLTVNRSKIHGYLHELGQPWCEDRTNRDLSRVRARLRHDVLPILEEIKPDAAKRAVLLADHITEAAELVESQVEHWHEHVMREGEGEAGGGAGGEQAVIDRGEARLLPRLVLIGLLRRVLIEAGCPRDRLTHRTLMPMVRAIGDTQGGVRQFDLPNGVTLKVTRQRVEVLSGTKEK